MGGQDIQSRFEPRHAGGKAGVIGAALLLEMLGDALAMGRDLVRTYPPQYSSTMHDILHSYRPELLHPFASAIDEPELKVPEEMVRVNRNRATTCLLMRGWKSVCADGAHDGIGTGLCTPA